ncbi:hypothetical protein NPD5_268 [Clostridium sporogenes]|uniref:Uncharacterized protein n=1 Tax=Clostridium sporogenes TaxID=1509 RepID=A0A1J1CZY3_CLOSG|nr:hypothetical protein [Clostridium sporogenes]APF28093.1 hypothetical protein NPD7_1255 [Clostridium sporogenes]APH16348.1 hypothetical protein NPD5_268 [Clostridium sporogenes]
MKIKINSTLDVKIDKEEFLNHECLKNKDVKSIIETIAYGDFKELDEYVLNEIILENKNKMIEYFRMSIAEEIGRELVAKND